MKIQTVETGRLMLDGGAMFGVVPRTLWERLNPPDEENRCPWSMRCLLVETQGRKILVDTGMGNKQGERFRSIFLPHGDNDLLGSLRKLDCQPEEITDVLLTHLHFDHVGGALAYGADGKLKPVFPNATYWSNEVHYNWAAYPNAREKASFLPENFSALKSKGVLKFIDVEKNDVEWMEGIHVRFVYGHTEAMMVPIFEWAGQTVIYCTDVIPSSFHLGVPYVMSYDLQPLITMEEKGRMVEDALAKGHYLFFEHDPETACVKLGYNAKGKAAVDEVIDISAIFPE